MKNKPLQTYKERVDQLGRYKQPDPITEGWEVYRKVVKTYIESHLLSGCPHSKCHHTKISI